MASGDIAGPQMRDQRLATVKLKDKSRLTYSFFQITTPKDAPIRRDGSTPKNNNNNKPRQKMTTHHFPTQRTAVLLLRRRRAVNRLMSRAPLRRHKFLRARGAGQLALFMSAQVFGQLGFGAELDFVTAGQAVRAILPNLVFGVDVVGELLGESKVFVAGLAWPVVDGGDVRHEACAAAEGVVAVLAGPDPDEELLVPFHGSGGGVGHGWHDERRVIWAEVFDVAHIG